MAPWRVCVCVCASVRVSACVCSGWPRVAQIEMSFVNMLHLSVKRIFINEHRAPSPRVSHALHTENDSHTHTLIHSYFHATAAECALRTQNLKERERERERAREGEREREKEKTWRSCKKVLCFTYLVC